MSLLNDSIKKQVSQALEPMEAPVRLAVFTQASGDALEIECTMCSETRQLAEEVAALSEKIQVEVHDFVKDAEVAEGYKIDKIPAIAFLRDGTAGDGQEVDYGIRMYGIPSGYEFSSFIHDLLMVSSGQPDLKPETLQELRQLKEPVHIQVYVTPT